MSSAKISGHTCPSCGVDGATVLETRRLTNGVRRQRKCAFCATSFTTLEIKLPEMTFKEGDYSRFYGYLDGALASYDLFIRTERRKEHDEKTDHLVGESANA